MKGIWVDRLKGICLFLGKLILALFYTALIAGWCAVYLLGGTFGIIGWWTIQFLSFPGVIILIISIIIVIIRTVRKQKPGIAVFVALVFSLFAGWPFGWFFGVGQMAYPVDINSVKPAVSIRLPIKQPALIGWGGDSIKTNYHAAAPMQRWAYDLLVPPAAIKSKRLEDYGIFGLEVIAPASGTIVKGYDKEEDIEPGSENFKSLLGNHVFLKLDETGTYLVICHLKQGSLLVKDGQHVEEGTPIARVGNSGSTSEPHIHIHHQRQDPTKTSMFLSEGLPLYFRDIEGPAMPKGGIEVRNGVEKPVGEMVYPVKK